MVSKRTSQRARKLMRENPGLRYQQALDQFRTETTSSPKQSAWLTALGIDKIATFDPRPTWATNEFDPHFRIMVGHQPDEPAAVVDVDFAVGSVGGTGPHGCIQGVTGSGKSTLLSGLVLGSCTRYSPSKLNFVLMDFKGGHTFRGFAGLPHVLANFARMQVHADAVGQVIEVIWAEIERRRALMSHYPVLGIVDYRTKCAATPKLYPPLSELVVVMDDLGEFIRENKEFGGSLKSLMTVGPSLGIHLLLGDQNLCQRAFAPLMEHFTTRISLTVGSVVQSTHLLGVDHAAKLPFGGAALMSTSTEGDLVAFQSFNSTAPMPGEDYSGSRELDVLLQRLNAYTTEDLGDRALADALADVGRRYPHLSR